MTRIIIQATSDDTLRSLVGLAIENQLRILCLGITKTKRKLEGLESEVRRPSGWVTPTYSGL